MGDKAQKKGKLDVISKKPSSRGRESDSTRRLPREDRATEDIEVTKKSASKKRENTRPIVREGSIKPGEREKTTELDIMDVEVVADEGQVKGEPTRKTKTSPPPHPKPAPKLPDPFEPESKADSFEPPDTLTPPESWQDDEIDASEWSTNPVRRILKKLRKG